MSYQPKMKKLILLSCVVFLFACKKDDTDPPVVTLFAPSANSFSYQEQIPIGFTVTDNRQIEEVRVVIRSVTHQQILQPLIFKSDKKSETFEGVIRFDDVHVESGSYYIQIVASDGENEGAAIKNIQLFSAPLLLTAVYGFDSENISTNVLRLSDGQWSNSFVVDSKPFFSLADSYDQRLLLAGNSSQGLLATDAESGVIIGQAAGISTQETLWQDAAYDESKRWWWLACKDGSIRAYNTLAQSRLQFNVLGNFLPNKITVSESYVIAAVSNAAQTQHRIDTYLKETGQLIHSLQVENKVDYLQALSDNRIWTFQGSEEMQQKVYVISNNYLDEWTNFRFASNGNLKKIVNLDNSMAMLFDDGIRIYSNSGQLVASNAISLENIFYEKLNNTIYAKASDSWLLFNGSLLTEEGSINANSSVSELLFLYNK
jgi:hypothetical protein